MSKWVHCLKCWDYALVEEEAPGPSPEVLPDFERYRRKYEAGDISTLPTALWFCLTNNEPVPDWLKDAYLKATHRVWSHEVSSWDDVFGKPLKKGRQRAAAQRKYALANPVWQRVMHFVHEANEKIEKDLFQRVGEEFGIGGTLAAEIFYEVERNEQGWENEQASANPDKFPEEK
jgi:hypothetical protein